MELVCKNAGYKVVDYPAYVHNNLLFAKITVCHFLTISVPQQSIPEVPSEFRREIHFAEHNNTSITQHTQPNWISFLAISGGCSCGFYLAESNPAENTSRMIAKYQKKGWTDAKIQRAIANRPSPSPRQTGLRDDIRNLISRLVMQQEELRLSLHWYSDDTETEKFSLDDLGTISLEEFLRDTDTFRDESTIVINKGEQAGAGNRRSAGA